MRSFLLRLTIQLHKNFPGQLSKNLKYYETLHVDDITHNIVKRGAKPSVNLHNKIREVEFKALGRKFKLILHPHREVLHQNFKAFQVNSDGNETIIHLDQDSFFRGRVFGEISSHVSAVSSFSLRIAPNFQKSHILAHRWRQCRHSYHRPSRGGLPHRALLAPPARINWQAHGCVQSIRRQTELEQPRTWRELRAGKVRICERRRWVGNWRRRRRSWSSCWSLRLHWATRKRGEANKATSWPVRIHANKDSMSSVAGRGLQIFPRNGKLKYENHDFLLGKKLQSSNCAS